MLVLCICWLIFISLAKRLSFTQGYNKIDDSDEFAKEKGINRRAYRNKFNQKGLKQQRTIRKNYLIRSLKEENQPITKFVEIPYYSKDPDTRPTKE